MSQVLMSYDNPTGAKLEELLDQVAAELLVKNATLYAKAPFSIFNKNLSVLFQVAANNNRIIEELRNCAKIQRETMALFDTLGPDRGPTARRI